MLDVGLVVEGVVDQAAANALLASRDCRPDPNRTIVTSGKTQFDARLPKYNQAARLAPWLALRDSDQDAGDCPAALRAMLLRAPQSEGLSVRLAVRTIEAWLLADADAVAAYFGISRAKVPPDPETLRDPKAALVTLCRSSKRRDVRRGMAPPSGVGGVGPEYTAFMTRYCREAWRVDTAAATAPSVVSLKSLGGLVRDNVACEQNRWDCWTGTGKG